MSSNSQNQIEVVKRSSVKPSNSEPNPKANPKSNLKLNPKANPKANIYNSPTIVEPEQQIKNGSCINTLKMHNGFLFVGSNTQFIKVYDMRENSDNYFKEITKINVGKGPVRDIFFVGNNLYVTCGIKKEDTKKLDGYFSYPISYKKFIVPFDNLNSNNSSNNYNITEEYAYPGVKIPEAILRRSRPEKEKGKPLITSFFINEDVDKYTKGFPIIGSREGVMIIQKKEGLDVAFDHFPYRHYVFDIKFKHNHIYSCCGAYIFMWDITRKNKPKSFGIKWYNKLYLEKMSFRKSLNSMKYLKELPINVKETIAKNRNKENNILKNDDIHNRFNLQPNIYNFVFINDEEILLTLYNNNNAFILNISTGKFRSRLPEEQIDYTVIGNPKVFKNKYYLSGVKDGYDIVLIFLDNQLDKPLFILDSNKKSDINDILVNDNLLLTGSKDGTIMKWNPKKFAPRMNSSKIQQSLRKLEEQNYGRNENIRKNSLKEKSKLIENIKNKNLKNSNEIQNNIQTKKLIEQDKKKIQEIINEVNKKISKLKGNDICSNYSKTKIKRVPLCDGKRDEVFGKIPVGKGICHYGQCYNACKWKKIADHTDNVKTRKEVRMASGQILTSEDFENIPMINSNKGKNTIYNLDCSDDNIPLNYDIDHTIFNTLENIIIAIKAVYAISTSENSNNLENTNFADLSQEDRIRILAVTNLPPQQLYSLESLKNIYDIIEKEIIRITKLQKRNKEYEIQRQKKEKNELQNKRKKKAQLNSNNNSSNSSNNNLPTPQEMEERRTRQKQQFQASRQSRQSQPGGKKKATTKKTTTKKNTTKKNTTKKNTKKTTTKKTKK